MTIDTAIGVANDIAGWQGWRLFTAIGAIGACFSLVLAWLRDNAAARQYAVSRAHLIEALIFVLKRAELELTAYGKARTSSEALGEFFGAGDPLPRLNAALDVIRSAKLNDWPSAEVMTSIFDLTVCFNDVTAKIDLGRKQLNETGSIDGMPDLSKAREMIAQRRTQLGREARKAASWWKKSGTLARSRA